MDFSTLHFADSQFPNFRQSANTNSVSPRLINTEAVVPELVFLDSFVPGFDHGDGHPGFGLLVVASFSKLNLQKLKLKPSGKFMFDKKVEK